jgi:hypothetical protein
MRQLGQQPSLERAVERHLLIVESHATRRVRIVAFAGGLAAFIAYGALVHVTGSWKAALVVVVIIAALAAYGLVYGTLSIHDDRTELVRWWEHKEIPHAEISGIRLVSARVVLDLRDDKSVSIRPAFHLPRHEREDQARQLYLRLQESVTKGGQGD